MDYEQKYPPDPIFEEAQPNARVWRMCVDEFQIFDTDLSEDARDTVDVLLVFVRRLCWRVYYSSDTPNRQVCSLPLSRPS